MSETEFSSPKETLVSFPCLFTFKAMLKNEPNAEKEVEKVVSEYANIVADGTSSRVSKKMTYVSVSCTAHLQNESQLKNIYQALKEHSMVIMTL